MTRTPARVLGDPATPLQFRGPRDPGLLLFERHPPRNREITHGVVNLARTERFS
jgi:hypothetical protein